ncbi:hypothetical protein [Bartonella sp. DGB2]
MRKKSLINTEYTFNQMAAPRLAARVLTVVNSPPTTTLPEGTLCL